MNSRQLTGLSLSEWYALRQWVRADASTDQLRIMARDYARMKRLECPNLAVSVAFAIVSRELRRRRETSFLLTRAPND